MLETLLATGHYKHFVIADNPVCTVFSGILSERLRDKGSGKHGTGAKPLVSINIQFRHIVATCQKVSAVTESVEGYNSFISA